MASPSLCACAAEGCDVVWVLGRSWDEGLEGLSDSELCPVSILRSGFVHSGICGLKAPVHGSSVL